MAQYDLVIRGGTIADGTGAATFEGDVAISGDRIVAVGKVADRGKDEINAKGRLVTPGFIDIHTHFDGQVMWDRHMTPSSGHGVTTVLMGNCGVGFAPCTPAQRAAMVDVMEGVEDIPGATLNAGLPWTWTTFPEYLTALETRRVDVDFATMVPHCPVRVFVMGDRGERREPASPEDIRRMAAIVREGVAAGGMGFSTSRAVGHRSASGDVVPSTTASEDELMGILLALKDLGAGTFMTASDFDTSKGFSSEFAMLRRLAETTGRPVHFPLLQAKERPDQWRELADGAAAAYQAGATMYGQVVARPVGVLFGLELTSHPFSFCVSYRAIKHLPLAERVKAMRTPELRARLLAEPAEGKDLRVMGMARGVDAQYPMGDPPNYSPKVEERLDNIAKRQGRTAFEVAYDVLLDQEGKGLLYHPARNFAAHNLDTVLEMLRRPETVIGLGDAGAHLGRICDSSMPTFLLTYWTRDRAGERLSVPWVVKALTSRNAAVVGFHDRGLLKPGYKADLNVIDYDRLTLRAPRATHDLPAGGMRLSQHAEGYDATILSGQVTFRAGRSTEAFPGKLVRGVQAAPTTAR
ncbi:MAG: D-aminoacylase [Alphaproteobacteria bacterium]|nr:D-aminoacylase [Alphaproteobacteria bacterium]